MAFEYAVRRLVESHANEVAALEMQIRNLQLNLQSRFIPMEAGPATSLADTTTGLVQRLVATHTSATTGPGWRAVSMQEDQVWREHDPSPSTPDLASRTLRIITPRGIQNREQSMGRQSPDSASWSSVAFKDSDMTSGQDASPCLIKIGSFTFAAHEQDDRQADEGYSQAPSSHHSASSQEVHARWETLTQGVLHRHSRITDFAVHTGWLESSTNDPSRTSSFGRDGSGIESLGLARKSGFQRSCLSQAQRAALAEQEQKAQKLKKGLHGQHQKPLSSSFLYIHSANSLKTTLSRGRANPESLVHRVWAICCLVLVLYETFTVTMAPFDIMNRTTAKLMEWVAASFWTLDILFNFFSGIYVDGRLETRVGVVAKAYLRTWFVLDMVIAVMQWIALFVSNDGLSTIAFLKIIRIMRSLRIVRFLYWFKNSLRMLPVGLATIMAGKLLQFLVAFYFFIHCSACLWYEIGKGHDGWVAESKDILSDSAVHNYLVSLHWALSQLQGNIDIYPGPSTRDRLFVVVSSVASICVLTYFVSVMTDTMLSAHLQRKKMIEEDRLMQEFFGRHDIKPEVRARAEHYLLNKRRQQHAIMDYDQDQKALQKFPSQLRAQLNAEIRAFSLKWHPIFAYLRKYHRSIFVKVCSAVLCLHPCSPSDDVFVVGEYAHYAYFILGGEFMLNVSVHLDETVAYWTETCRRTLTKELGSEKGEQSPASQAAVNTGFNNEVDLDASEGSSTSEQGDGDDASQPKRSLRSDCKSVKSVTPSIAKTQSEAASEMVSVAARLMPKTKPTTKLSKGDFVSEASLWMPWVHVGGLCSVEHGQYFSVGVKELIDVLGQHSMSHAAVSSYARRFVEAAKHLRQVNHSDNEIETMSFHSVLEIEAENGQDDLDFSV